MKKIKSQSGFAHLAILTVVLALALVGTLGYVYWQNFMQPKVIVSKTDNSKTTDSSDKSITPAPSEIALTEIASDQTGGSGLAIKYPSAWSYNHKTKDVGVLGDEDTITSPDSKIKIRLSTHLDGVGGTCGDASSDELGIITNLDEDSVPGLPDYGFVAITVHSSAGYSFRMGVESNSTDGINRKLKIGDSGCIITLGLIGTNKMLSGLSVDTSGEPSLQQPNGVSLDDINNFKQSDNYKIAKRIVQSLYVK